MTFTPQLIDNTEPGESLRSGADKINENFTTIADSIGAPSGIATLDSNSKLTGCTDKETTSSGTTPWSIQMINCSRAVITGNYLGNDVQYWGATPVASGNYIPS